MEIFGDGRVLWKRRKVSVKGENSRGCIPELPGQSGEWSGDHIRKSWANLWIYPSLHFRLFFLGAAHKSFALQPRKQIYCEIAILTWKLKLPWFFVFFLSFLLFFFFFFSYWSCLEKTVCFHLYFFLSQNLLCEQRICSNWLGRVFPEFLGTSSFLHLLWALELCMETSHKVFP